MDDSENEELMQQMALQVFLHRWNRTGSGDGGDSLIRREVPLSSPSLIVSQTMSTHSSSIRDVRSWERDPNNIKNEGCKRCLCKNSKCLMLYCACFVSGEYCAEGCGCQDCHNKSNNEEMIHGIRQQIESRDPHAFRRKVVKHATESSQNSGGCNFYTSHIQCATQPLGDWPPFPQIFIRGKFVGGSDVILDLCQSEN